MPWELLPLLPLGILAGLLSGLLGIGGGLIFSPLLLAQGLTPHQALATSTLAIVPTTLAGSWAHLRSGQVPRPAIFAIGLSAASGALLFSRAGSWLAGWQLLALQSLIYAVLAVVVGPRQDSGVALEAAGESPLPLVGIAAVGLVAGLAG
ncbi:MAG: TSUP family transporter, partial [Cyanobium sp.]